MKIKFMDAKDVKLRLSENMRRIRKMKGFTQFTLAEKAGVSEETIKSVELCLNWPSENTLAQIANALEIDIVKLFMPTCESIELSGCYSEIKCAISEKLKMYVDSVFKDFISD